MMAKVADSQQIGELQDEIKRRDERIEELRGEVDELRDLVRRMEENIEDHRNVIERWTETFEMEMTDDGSWTWEPFWEEHEKLVDDYNDLVRRWNKQVPLINCQNVGRPLGASEAQCAQVLKLRKAGKSLRGIAEETSLGLSTVRTIIAKENRSDRTTKLHRARIDPSSQPAVRAWKRQKRIGDALPRQVTQVLEDGGNLLKEAKGLGRAK